MNRESFASGVRKPLHRRNAWWASAAGLSLLLATSTVAASGHHVVVGLDDLAERIGEDNLPTGESLEVAIVEGLQNGNYRPDENHSQFDGKDFAWMSGPSGVSAHATGVGRRFFGLQDGLVPLIPKIYSYNASTFMQGDWLRAHLSPFTPPLPAPGDVRVANHSWVGVVDGFDNAVLRRTDYVVENQNVLMVAGVHNSSSNFPLLSNMFNGLSVGRTSGQHGSGPTIDGVDVPGRMKPEIVAPGGTTSSATPVVSSAAAMMIDIARTHPELVDNPVADRVDVAKAVLLAGARHEDDWSNNPVTEGAERGITNEPIDEVFGVGTVNVDRSHMVLTAGQHPGSPSVPQTVPHAGWDRAEVAPNGSAYWQFDVPALADEVSIIATWNRKVSSSNMNSWSIAHFELELWRLNDRASLASLVGEGGLDYFGSGNVVSTSPIDNIQHLYIRDLEPGDYVLELRRVDSLNGSRHATVAWLLPEPDGDELIPGDINGDGVVDSTDLLILLGEWGPCGDPDDCPADINGDGVVDSSDLLILLGNWGATGDK